MVRFTSFNKIQRNEKLFVVLKIIMCWMMLCVRLICATENNAWKSVRVSNICFGYCLALNKKRPFKICQARNVTLMNGFYSLISDFPQKHIKRFIVNFSFNLLICNLICRLRTFAFSFFRLFRQILIFRFSTQNFLNKV